MSQSDSFEEPEDENGEHENQSELPDWLMDMINKFQTYAIAKVNGISYNVTILDEKTFLVYAPKDKLFFKRIDTKKPKHNMRYRYLKNIVLDDIAKLAEIPLVNYSDLPVNLKKE
jgi:hypothetical protein